MRLTCDTCGADLELSPAEIEGRTSVPCPVCSSDVAIQTVTLELDDGGENDALDMRALPQSLPELDTRDMSPSEVQDPTSLEFGDNEGSGASDGGGLRDDSPIARAEAKLARLASPSSRSAPITRQLVRSPVTISRRSASPWRGYFGWGAFVAVVMVVASYVAYERSRPPPPPRIANPLEKAADGWFADGTVKEATPVRDAVSIAKTKLRGSRQERLEALRMIQRGLVDDPNEPEAIAVYARVLSTLPSARDENTVALALRGITAAIGDAPNSEHRAELEEARAWLLLEERRLDQARDAAARAVEYSPTSRSAQAVRAASNVEFRPADAVPALRELVSDPEVGNDAQRWLAVALLRSGEVTEAIGLLEDAVERAPSADGLLRELYEVRYAMGDVADARAVLERLMELGIASLEDRVVYARDLARNERKAERALQVLEAGEKDEAAGALRLAELYAEKVTIASTTPGFIPDPRELSLWLERGLELAPDSPVLLYARTLADDALGREERALDGLEVANGMYPEVPEMAVELAWRLREVDQAAAGEVIDDAL
ncbi:MAG: tetratricopeptide repeat protein, partial [Myxococcota bacterium]